ncbi:MAG: S-layer homology domain-containing protein [Syntrophothermaceae bacterium]
MRPGGSTRNTIALLTALVFMLSMVFTFSLTVPTVVAVEDEPTIASDVSEPESILEVDEEQSVSNFVYDSVSSIEDDVQIDPREEDQGLIEDPLDEQVIPRNEISVFGVSGGSALYGAETLLASTLLGGERSECVSDLVIGPEGKVYVVGTTISPDFPKTAESYAYESKPNANYQHAFVAILDSTLSNVEACTTFIGETPQPGSGTTQYSVTPNAIGLDNDGNVYIAGKAGTQYFPTTEGAYMGTYPTSAEARDPGFICKLNSDLSSLIASTYFNAPPNDLVVDSEGNVYVTGIANNRILANFPVTFNNSDYAKGKHEVFITKLDSNLSKVEASTIIGSNEKDEGNALTLDSDGNVYVTGFCRNEFPKTEGVYSSWGAGSRDRSFVAKLSNQLEVLASTAIDTISNAADITLDNEGNIYITGPTPSDSAYILKLSNDLKELRASTSIGTGKPTGQDLVVDSEGDIYVLLVVSGSGTIPTTQGAYADQSKGGYELGIAKFDSNLSELIASTYFGGSGSEGTGGAAIALDDNNNIFIASGTMSIDRALIQGNPITPLDFPLTDNAFQKEVPVRYTNIGGGTTGFISKFQAPPNWNTNVYTFALDEQVAPAVIDTQEHTIDITVQNKTDLTSLAPQIILSPGAAITPASGQAVDFGTSEETPVVYTVTAENGTDQQEWEVTVYESGVPVLQQALITPAGDIKLVFDIEIAELPDGAAEQFVLTVNEEPVTIDPIATNTENAREVLLSLASKISSGAAINLAYTRAEEEAFQVKSSLGKALESFETSSFLKEPPALQVDTEGKRIGQEVVITFDNDAAWRSALTGITVNDQEITTEQYSMADGSITINAAVFIAAGDYNIKVLADGYGCSEVIQTMEAAQPLGIKAAEVTFKGDVMLFFDEQIVLPEKGGVTEQFIVKVNGSEVSVNSVTAGYSGDRVTLELVDKPQGGQTVTVGYTGSTTDDSLHIKSAYGEVLEDFSDYEVSNNLPVEELIEAPILKADTCNDTVGKPVNITFTDNEGWRDSVRSIIINNSPLEPGQYRITEGNIQIQADVFKEAGEYTIVAKATNFMDATVVQKMFQAIAVTEEQKSVDISSETIPVKITVPDEVTDAILDMQRLLEKTDNKVTTRELPEIKIEASVPASSTTPVKLEIPQGAAITASTDWDGTINVPREVAKDQVTIKPDSGKTATVTAVIEVGAGDIELTFTKPVKLVIPGQAGKDAGFQRGETFTPITTVLTATTQEEVDAELGDKKEGKQDVDDDLVIWTKHFTKFVTYEQTATSGDDGDGGDSGGNNGGGTGDGSGGGEGSGTPGGLKILSLNKVSLSPTDTLLQFDFGNGMDRTLSSNLNHIKVYEKTSGNEVKWSNHNYIKQGSGNDTFKLRRLELMFNNLKSGTTYVVELGPEVEANNGSTLGVTRKYEFTTTGTATAGPGGGGGGPAVEKAIGKDGGTITEHGARIEIPAAAFDQNVKVTVEKVVETSKLPMVEKSKLASDVVEITKDKTADFKKPVTITLNFNKSKVDTGKYDLQLCRLDEKENKWIPLDNINVDLAAGKVSGETTHFTKFAVIATEKDAVGKEEPKPEEPGKVVSLADVKGHWAEKTIEELVATGAIKGYPDGTFKPNQGITRAEFASITVKAFELETKSGKVFNDTADHWAKDAIATAATYGIVNGYSDTVFGVSDQITREQMAAMIVRAANLTEVTEGKQFVDSDKISAWAKNAVATASENQIINGYPDNTFRPQAGATRAEAATVMVKALKPAA